MNAPVDKFNFPPDEKTHSAPPELIEATDEAIALAETRGDAGIAAELKMFKTTLDNTDKYKLGATTGLDLDLKYVARLRSGIKGEDLRDGGPVPVVRTTMSPAAFRAEQAAPYAGPEISFHHPASGEEVIVPPVGMGAHEATSRELRGRMQEKLGATVEQFKDFGGKPIDPAEIQAHVHAELEKQTAPVAPLPPAPPILEAAAPAVPKAEGPVRAASWTGREEPARTPEVIAPVAPKVIGGEGVSVHDPVSEQAVAAAVIHEQYPSTDPGTSGEKLRGFLTRLRGRTAKTEVRVEPTINDPMAIPATWANQAPLPPAPSVVEVPPPVKKSPVAEKPKPIGSEMDLVAAPGATIPVVAAPPMPVKRVPKVAVGSKGQSLKKEVPHVIPKPENAIGGLAVGPEKNPARGEKVLNWLKGVDDELSAKAEKLGGKDLAKMFRGAGEWYNNQNKWAKIGVGLGLGGAAALSLPFSSLAAGAFGVGIGTQRILGGLGRFVTIEKNLQKIHDGQELKGFIIPKLKVTKKSYTWLAKQPENVRARASVALAVMYSLAFSAAIGETVKVASSEVMPMLAHLWPQGAEHSAAAPVVQHDAAPVTHAPTPPSVHAAPLPKPVMGGGFNVPPASNLPDFPGGGSGNPSIDLAAGVPHDTVAYHPEGTEVASAPTAEVAAPVPSSFDTSTLSVGASSHGTEGMIKHMWEQMQGKNIPLPADHDSDLYKLLTADEKTIGAVAHRIAIDPKHHFFEADKTTGISKEVIVGQHAQMTIKDGNILFTPDDHAVATAHVENLNRIRTNLGLKAHALPSQPAGQEPSADVLTRDPAMTHAHQDGPVHPATAEAAPTVASAAPIENPSQSLPPLEHGADVASPITPHPLEESAQAPATSIEHLAERLESVKSPIEARTLIDAQIQQSGVSPQLVAEVIKVAPHMRPDLSLMSYVEPNTGAIPGPAVFLGNDGHLTVYGAVAEGNNYEAQIEVAKKFAVASGKPVNVLLPDGAKGHAIVSWNGSVTKETGGFLRRYVAPQSIRDSVYVFPR